MSRKKETIVRIFIFVVIFFCIAKPITVSAQQQNNTSDEEVFTNIKSLFNCLFFGECKVDESAPPPVASDDQLLPTQPAGTPVPIPTANPNLSVWQQKMQFGCNKIYALIHDRCANSSATSSNGCYNNIRDDELFTKKDADLPNRQLASQELSSSISNIGALQCVGFVRACAALAGAPFNTRGNAKDYANGIPGGYRFIKKGSEPLQVGDITVWNIGKYGHIAVVIAIESTNNFQVAEANLLNPGDNRDPYNNGFVAVRSKRINSPPDKIDNWAVSLVGWLRKV